MGLRRGTIYIEKYWILSTFQRRIMFLSLKQSKPVYTFQMGQLEGRCATSVRNKWPMMKLLNCYVVRLLELPVHWLNSGQSAAQECDHSSKMRKQDYTYERRNSKTHDSHKMKIKLCGTSHLLDSCKRTMIAMCILENTNESTHLTKITRLCSIKYWPNSSKVLLTPSFSILRPKIHHSV